jgi:hypothetical protein
MTFEELLIRYKRVLEKTKRTRGWQRQYEKYHVTQDKQYKRRHERELDAILMEEEKVLKLLESELAFK